MRGVTTDPDVGRPGDGWLRWTLCVSTINRLDSLELCVRCALAQTRLPSEIVIVDASDDWDVGRDRISALVAGTGIPLTYLAARKKSLTVQRNQGIQVARADILFLIDDDSLLFPDAAKEIMRLYEAPGAGDVVAIGLDARSDSPVPEAVQPSGQKGTTAGKAALRLSHLGVISWINREVFMLTNDRLFFEYTPRPCSFSADGFAALQLSDARYANHITGFRLTARRAIALKEPFNALLLGYSALEDLDAVYRWRRHGYTIQSRKAGVYHYTATASRLSRKKSTQLCQTNIALFVRMNSKDLRHDGLFLSIRLLRRCLAELLKDALTQRFSFPGLRGVIAAAPVMFRVMTMPNDALPGWYERYQSDLLWGRPTPPPPPGLGHQQGAS